MSKVDFKDSKFGKFLDKAKDLVSDKAPELGNALFQVATGNPAQGIQTAIEALRGSESEDADKLALNLELQKEVFLAELRDIQNAREMQVAALNQDDNFSKRFIYIFAIVVFGFSALVVLLLFFINIPDDNKQVINMTLGVIVGTGLASIINFFFGSSQGSKDKEKKITNLTK